MNTRKSVSILAFSLVLGGGMFATPALADLPKEPADIKVMDANKNGKIEKDEYIAFLSKMFDKTAGAKGYCTFEEVRKGLRDGFDIERYGR